MEPSNYPEAVNLPFNFSSVKSDFDFSVPAADLPDEDGFWAVIQGNNAVLEATPHGLHLPYGRLPDWLVPQHPALRIGTWHGRPLRAVTISSGVLLELPLTAAAWTKTAPRGMAAAQRALPKRRAQGIIGSEAAAHEAGSQRRSWRSALRRVVRVRRLGPSPRQGRQGPIRRQCRGPCERKIQNRITAAPQAARSSHTRCSTAAPYSECSFAHLQ